MRGWKGHARCGLAVTATTRQVLEHQPAMRVLPVAQRLPDRRERRLERRRVYRAGERHRPIVLALGPETFKAQRVMAIGPDLAPETEPGLPASTPFTESTLILRVLPGGLRHRALQCQAYETAVTGEVTRWNLDAGRGEPGSWKERGRCKGL